MHEPRRRVEGKFKRIQSVADLIANTRQDMKGHFALRRVVWNQENDSLETSFYRRGYLVFNTPVIVSLNYYDLYDIVLSLAKVEKFDSEYQKVKPFSDDDPLVKVHGKPEAVRKTKKRYIEELEQGVWTGTENWFKTKISALEEFHSWK